MSYILVIDDEIDIAEVVKDILEDEIEVETKYALNVKSALNLIYQNLPKIIILDVWLEGSEMDGLGLMKKILEYDRSIPIIVISGHGNIQTAVKAIKLGAYDFIEKPFNSEKLIVSVKRAIENQELKSKNWELKNSLDLSSIIGNSKAILEIRKQLNSNIVNSTRILINGEIGTGKTVLAKLIHNKSVFNTKPFINIDIKSMSDIELEKTILCKNNSVFQQNTNATLFLKEISNLSKINQKRLVEQINFINKHNKKLQILSSSSANLEKLVKDGEFNSDLYSRINSTILKLPALQERAEDIEAISKYFIQTLKDKYNVPKIKIADNFYYQLVQKNWECNISELKNFIEYKIIQMISNNSEFLNFTTESKDTDENKINDYRYQELFSKNFKEAKKLFEKEYISFQISRCGKNISQIAKIMEIERTSLHRKIKELKIT
ncbi:MAG: two-component system nitrogen regulation response regulator NtrX [Candidatus Midichloriaceae bacterium]|jgi:two-component system nitrogen regulation response regulator NtrX